MKPKGVKGKAVVDLSYGAVVNADRALRYYKGIHSSLKNNPARVSHKKIIGDNLLGLRLKISRLKELADKVEALL